LKKCWRVDGYRILMRLLSPATTRLLLSKLLGSRFLATISVRCTCGWYA